MARLNEVPMSTDSIETLRRKFLRQNRDIARVNSAQSLRIRSLESECGRLLSDNLTLNGRILELERDLEECREAQRIADHALEVKAKMEAQLEEWSAMLGGLGVERAAKRHARSSPGGTVARKRTSMDRSPVAKQRPRDSRSSADMAALHEGRLPPIQENTTFPRRTMNHSEILAICSEAEHSKDSPDLGPPPTSRFVEEPVKVDSPSRSTGASQPSPKLRIEALLPSSSPSRPDIEPTKQPTVTLESSSQDDSRPIKPIRPSVHPAVKAGSKRKFGDENDETQLSRAFFPSAEKPGNKIVTDKPRIVRDLKDSSGANNLSSRPDEKKPETTDPTKKRPRQPLADKSRNDGMASPKKLAKSAANGDLVKVMADPPKEISLKAAPLKKKRVVPIKLPSLPPPGPSAAKQPMEPETPSADPGIVFPDTPETKSTTEKPRDTPPPADISSHGETSRPSRRVRASVSYAEPNLRDKMRRPTKEMLDAVSGEGKYKRTSSAHHVTSVSASKPAAEGELTRSAPTTQPPTAEAAMENEAARRPPVMSPLSQKDPVKEVPLAGQAGQAMTERRRRPSSRQSQLFEKLEKAEDEQDEECGAEESHAIDPYEFRDESTMVEQPRETYQKGKGSKGSRRSTVAKNMGTDDQLAPGADTRKPSRKRSSMAAPKKSSMLDEQDEDSSYDASLETARDASSSLPQDKASRRRSMML